MASYLMPISDREALVWILRESRTALPAHRRREAQQLVIGDRLLLYTTRSCFRNPTRDRGRIIGVATVTRRAAELADPVRFGQREFSIEVKLSFRVIVPRAEGIELAPMVAAFPRTFPNPRAWSATIRRALVPFDEDEAEHIVEGLNTRTVTPQAIDSYTTLGSK